MSGRPWHTRPRIRASTSGEKVRQEKCEGEAFFHMPPLRLPSRVEGPISWSRRKARGTGAASDILGPKRRESAKKIFALLHLTRFYAPALPTPLSPVPPRSRCPPLARKSGNINFGIPGGSFRKGERVDRATDPRQCFLTFDLNLHGTCRSKSEFLSHRYWEFAQSRFPHERIFRSRSRKNNILRK
jgi:hypothetical protein